MFCLSCETFLESVCVLLNHHAVELKKMLMKNVKVFIRLFIK